MSLQFTALLYFSEMVFYSFQCVDLTHILLTVSLIFYVLSVILITIVSTVFSNHSSQIYRSTIDSFYIDLVCCDITLLDSSSFLSYRLFRIFYIDSHVVCG